MEICELGKFKNHLELAQLFLVDIHLLAVGRRGTKAPTMTTGILMLQLRIRSTTTKMGLNLLVWKDSYSSKHPFVSSRLGSLLYISNVRCEGASGQYSPPRNWPMTSKVEPLDWVDFHHCCSLRMALVPFVLRLQSKSLLLVAGRAYRFRVHSLSSKFQYRSQG